jgi:hypothetical protein
MKTSYYAMMRQNPMKCPISVAGKCPSWYTGKQFKTLAPKYDWWIKWEEKAKEVGFDNLENNLWYEEQYKQTVLDKLSVKDVLIQLHLLALCPLDEITLLCYETPDKFCHRHLIANWLNEWYRKAMEKSTNGDVSDMEFCTFVGFHGVEESDYANIGTEKTGK